MYLAISAKNKIQKIETKNEIVYSQGNRCRSVKNYNTWEIPEPKEAFNRVCGPLGTASPRANQFRELLLTIPQSNILVYLDGSKAFDGNAGGGYAIYQLGRLLQTRAFPLGKSKEIYDAEAYAALKGIEAACALSTTRFSKYLWLFTDNLEVAKKLTTKAATTSSQKIFIDALEADK
ncbi:hypothetical protein K3495_g8674 [Podosphaera aphanis]|nr:hypothetical protein K3495_g8674 [Podosphaera aphanis]